MMSHASTPYENFELAVQLAENFEENFIELGRILRRLLDDDPMMFKQVCAETRLLRRKAYHLVRIARQTEHLPIPKAQLAAIKWTKADIISQVLTKDNWQEWLELAAKHTARDLRILVRGEAVVEGTRSVLLHFAPKDYLVFVKALRAHGAKRKSAALLGKEEAIMRLIAKVEAADG